jgi:malonyl-CoA O-methyltransferase
LGRNLHPQRFSGLRGRQWRDKLHEALQSEPLQLTFEIIYGHAFKPQARLNVRPETVLSLAEMREALNQRKSYPPKP